MRKKEREGEKEREREIDLNFTYDKINKFLRCRKKNLTSRARARRLRFPRIFQGFYFLRFYSSRSQCDLAPLPERKRVKKGTRRNKCIKNEI